MAEWNPKKHRRNTWILLLILLPFVLIQYRYRFKHPEMTETQLFLHFFDAFKEL